MKAIDQLSTNKLMVYYGKKPFSDNFPVCLNCGLASQPTAKFMSGRCLHFIGLLPNIRM